MSEHSEKGERPAHWLDPIIEAYKKDVDRTLLRENLKLTPDQRLANLESMLASAEEMRRAMRAAKTKRVKRADDSVS
jgi:hypothetical protein